MKLTITPDSRRTKSGPLRKFSSLLCDRKAMVSMIIKCMALRFIEESARAPLTYKMWNTPINKASSLADLSNNSAILFLSKVKSPLLII